MNTLKSFRAFALLTIFATIGFASYAVHRDEQRKVHALGLDHVTTEIARRHIAIVEEMPTIPVRDDMFPVHIMFREKGSDAWMLWGTGTYLKNYEPSIITAYHLFGGHPGEFGYRTISRRIFTGEEPIFPIVAVFDPLVNDSILCSADEKGNKFPRISVPERVLWRFKEHGSTITFHQAFGTVRLLTRPQKPLKLLFWTEVETGGARYCFFEGGTTRGESGTGGIVDTAGEKSLLVALRNVEETGIKFRNTQPIPGPYGVGMILNYDK
ncbi:MAG: hypothetical protein Q7R64_02640 [bacterium]|nr:hypothetical protein [bacterium]